MPEGVQIVSGYGQRKTNKLVEGMWLRVGAGEGDLNKQQNSRAYIADWVQILV